MQPQPPEAGGGAASTPAAPVHPTTVPPLTNSSRGNRSGVGGGVTPKQQLRQGAQHLCLELWHLANGAHPDVAHCTPLRVALQHLWSTLLGQDVPPVLALLDHQACDPRSLVGGLDGTLLSPTTGTTTATGSGSAATPGGEVGPTPTAWVQPFRLRNQVPNWANPESGLEGIYRHVRAQRRMRLPQANWVEEARSAAAAHALALAEGAAAAAAAKRPRPDDKRIIRIKNSAPAPIPSSSSDVS